MDHRFYFDPLSDRYEARLEDGLEVIGFWLSAEIGQSLKTLEQCQQLLARGQAEQQLSLRQLGRQYSLVLHQGEVCIRANGHDAPADLSDFADDGLELYQSESEAWCGLEDLQQLLTAWREFVPMR